MDNVNIRPYTWLFLIRPVAFAAIQRGGMKTPINDSHKTKRVNATVYSGTCPNQISNMNSISTITGIANIAARK